MLLLIDTRIQNRGVFEDAIVNLLPLSVNLLPLSPNVTVLSTRFTHMLLRYDEKNSVSYQCCDTVPFLQLCLYRMSAVNGIKGKS